MFNDNGTFQQWILDLMPHFVTKTDDPERAHILSEKIQELVFERAHNLLCDEKGKFHDWVNSYFQKEKQDSDKIKMAEKTFKYSYVWNWLSESIISLFLGELRNLRVYDGKKSVNFISTVINLIEHQHKTNNIFLNEGRAVSNSPLLKKLLGSEPGWDIFLRSIQAEMRRLPLGNCGKFISLLRLGNIVKDFPEDSTTQKSIIHELLYQVRKFNDAQKSKPSVVFEQCNKIDKEVDDLINLFGGEAKKVSQLPVDRSRGLVEDAALMFKYHLSAMQSSIDERAALDFKYSLSPIRNRLDLVDSSDFVRLSGTLVEKLMTQGNDLLADSKDHSIKEKIESHLKKLENARCIIDIHGTETLKIQAEMLRSYAPSPEVFPTHIRNNFKNVIQILTVCKDRKNLLPLFLSMSKFANAIAKACDQDWLESTTKAYFSLIPELSVFSNIKYPSDQKLIEKMNNYSSIFNKLYSDKRIISVDKRSDEASENKDADQSDLELINIDNIFFQYTNIHEIVERQVANGVDERLTESECLNVLKHVTDGLVKGVTVTKTELQLNAIIKIMSYLESRNVKVNRPSVEDFKEITAPYLEVRSILTLACLRKNIFNSAIGEQFKPDILGFIASNPNVDVEKSDLLYSTFISLQKLSKKTVGKKDALSVAGASICTDGCLMFKKILRNESTDITPKQLKQILTRVNKVITCIDEQADLLFALKRLQKTTLPSGINGKAVFGGSLIGFIGVAVMVAGYYFSPMTLGVSAIIGEKLGSAIIIGAGALIAGSGAYVVSSNLSSGLAKSLGGFLSVVPKPKPTHLPDDKLSSSQSDAVPAFNGRHNGGGTLPRNVIKFQVG